MTPLRVFLLIMTISAITIGLAVWHSNNMNLECENKNGVLVKTMQGWTCIDVKVIK